MVEYEYTKPIEERATDGQKDYEPTPRILSPELAFKVADGIQNAIGSPLEGLTKKLEDISDFSDDDKTLASPMKEASDAIQQLLEKLKTSSRTDLIHQSIGFTFSFSKDTTVPVTPPDGTVAVPNRLKEPLIGAVSHNIGNKVTLFGMYRFMEDPPLSIEEQERYNQQIIEWPQKFRQADVIELDTDKGETHIRLISHDSAENVGRIG